MPGDVATLRAAVDQFLEAQGFQRKRNLGHVQVWELGRDWRTRMRRALKAGAYRIPRDVEIEVRVTEVPGGPHPVLVALRVDATRARATRVGTATASVIAAGIGIAASAALLPMPLEALAIGGGGLAGVGGSWLSRASYRTECARLTVAVERFLDFLEHEPPPAPQRSPDPLKRLVDFLSREWWR